MTSCSRSFARGLLGGALLFTPVFMLAACGDPAEDRPALVGEGGAPSETIPPPVVPGPCPVGAQQRCSVVLGYYAGQKQCFVGMAVCVDGNWSECLDPESRHGKEVIARAQGNHGDKDPQGAAGAAAD